MTTGTGQRAIGDALRRGLERMPELGVPGTGRVADDISTFLALLEEWNARINLVSRRTDRDELVTRHVLESLEGLPHLPPARRKPYALVDIGSGGGFPAIPLLVARRDLQGVLVEATGKKCSFLRAAVERLELTAQVVNARFPVCFERETPVEADVVTSRAVAGVWPEARRVRGLWTARTRGLFWTTPDAWRGPDEPLCKTVFHPSRLGERRGIAVAECST